MWVYFLPLGSTEKTGHIGVNPGGGRDSPFYYGGVVGFPWNIIFPYNVQEYEMKTLSKVLTFQK